MSYQRNPDALHAEVNGSLILMNVESLAYFEFNDVAKRIWNLSAILCRMIFALRYA